MIVEEAGQVLESHILAGLIDSVQHLVLVGDPLQLRPTLNNFGECCPSLWISFPDQTRSLASTIHGQ